jgi:hypothetical protein
MVFLFLFSDCHMFLLRLLFLFLFFTVFVLVFYSFSVRTSVSTILSHPPACISLSLFLDRLFLTSRFVFAHGHSFFNSVFICQLLQLVRGIVFLSGSMRRWYLGHCNWSHIASDSVHSTSSSSLAPWFSFTLSRIHSSVIICYLTGPGPGCFSCITVSLTEVFFTG